MDNKKINELPVAQNLGDTSILPVSVNMGSFWQTFKLTLSALKSYLSGYFVTKTSLSDLLTNPTGAQEGKVLVASDDGTSGWSNNIGSAGTAISVVKDLNVGGTTHCTDFHAITAEGTGNFKVSNPNEDVFSIDGEDGHVKILKKATINDLILSGLDTFADEAAASSLASGVLYKTSTGELRIKL